MADANAFLIYQDDNGVPNANVRFEGEDAWLTAEQLKQTAGKWRFAARG